MVRIYTRTGDDGTTELIGGQRVPKDAPCIEANGALDELNALLGVVRAHALPDRVDAVLQDIQNQLFRIGAELATPAGAGPARPGVGDAEIQKLEETMDAFAADLRPLRRFILPGGTMAGAHLHLARAVARRAERQCVAMARTVPTLSGVLRYLNRLSDLCFVLARYVNQQQSMPEQQPPLP